MTRRVRLLPTAAAATLAVAVVSVGVLLGAGRPVTAGLTRRGVSPDHPVALVGGPDSRIVGPDDLTVGDGNPWQFFQFLVKLMRVDVVRGVEDVNLVCGGALLRPNKVLTAAHCIGGTRGVRVGDAVQVGGLTIGSGFTAFISEVAIHPRYTDSEQGFDMAVLTIGNPPTTALYNTGNVRKAGVNKEAAALAATTPLTIAGWGNVSGRGGRTLSTTLRQVASRTTDWAACRADADRNAGSLPANAEDLLVCASSAGATSTCAGDSGSPLFLRSRGAGSDRPTVKVVGVMSFGYGSPLDACPPGSPSFYTRVDTNVDWIFSHLDGGWRGWERAP